MVGVLAVWLVAALIGALLRRRTVPEEPGRLPIAVLAAIAVAALGVGLVLLPVSVTPEAFPQHPDTIFHLGVSQWMVEHHDASFLHAEDFRRLSGPGGYQAAFHAMVATIAQISGASVVVSTSSFVLVIAGVAWPLGCVFLARTLFGPNLAVTLSAGVLSVAFSAYPFMLMGYGVVWPNLFAQTLLPGALALLAVVMSAAHRQSPPLTSKLRALLLLFATLPGLAVAHPNALLTFLMFGFLMAAGIIVSKAWDLRRSRPLLATSWIAGLVMAIGLVYVVSTVIPTKGGGMRFSVRPGPELPIGKALQDTLLFAQPGAPALWVLAALVAVGAGIVLVRGRHRRWLVAAVIITSALFFLNVAVDNPTTRMFTWPWNNTAPRLAAIVVLPAVLLATVGLASGARYLQALLGLQTRVRLPPWTPAVVVPLLFVMATGGAYVEIHRTVLNPYFHPDPAFSLVTRAELQALQTLARHIPPTAVVAENPWNGGSYMYVVSGRLMLFPTVSDRAGGDRTLLATSLDEVGSSPEVCAAARRENVQFAITGGRSVRSKGGTQYPGVDAVRSSDAFQKVAKEGPYTLYRMVSCAES